MARVKVDENGIEMELWIDNPGNMVSVHLKDWCSMEHVTLTFPPDGSLNTFISYLVKYEELQRSQR